MKNTNKYFSKVVLAVVMFASAQAIAEPASKKQVEDVQQMLDYVVQQLRTISDNVNMLLRR